MSNQSQTATVRKAHGKDLSEYGGNVPAVLEVPYSYDAAEDLSEVPDDEKLTDEDILAVINRNRNAAARAAAVNKVLSGYGITPPALTTQEKSLNSIVRALVAVGTSEADARQMASAMLAGK